MQLLELLSSLTLGGLTTGWACLCPAGMRRHRRVHSPLLRRVQPQQVDHSSSPLFPAAAAQLSPSHLYLLCPYHRPLFLPSRVRRPHGDTWKRGGGPCRVLEGCTSALRETSYALHPAPLTPVHSGGRPQLRCQRAPCCWPGCLLMPRARGRKARGVARCLGDILAMLPSDAPLRRICVHPFLKGKHL